MAQFISKALDSISEKLTFTMRNPINIENITHKGKSGENQNPNGNVNFERFKNAN